MTLASASTRGLPEGLTGSYAMLAVGGLLLTAWIWGRLTSRHGAHDARLTIIYFVGLLGAVVGAKLSFLLAEGWRFRHDWVALLTGRSVTGAILGGYAAVEIAKTWLRYPRTTGDVFAIVVPLGLVVGRIGCLLQGCCPGVACEQDDLWAMVDSRGVPRWPAALVELLFNAGFLAWAVLAQRFGWMPGNRFHVFLIAYGLFRFGHEFARDDARWVGPIGGYHVIALAMAAFGAWRLAGRRRDQRIAQGLGLTPSAPHHAGT